MRAAVAAVVVSLSLGVLTYACVFSKTTSNKPDASSSSGGTFDRNALLRSLGDNVFTPTYAEFVTATETLEATTAKYAATLDVAERDAARLAWREAMDVWQRAELFQIGPAGVSGVAVGGRDLRDEIYSWALVNRCATDQVLVSRAFNDLPAFRSQLVNVRGLDAMEYVLFNESTSNMCAPQVPINADGTWDALTDLEQRRADYASALAVLVHENAVELSDAWSPSGDDFASELARAGSSDAGYESAQVALNAVSDAMFYLEAVTKDVKLALPTGLSADCTADTCPEELELRFARYSKQAIRQNIIGFELVFTGGDGLGFDDWLRDIGAGDVADAMIAELANAHVALDTIEESDLVSALEQDPQSVEQVYFALKKVSDVLKSDFITTLDLDLPNAVQGDND
jgi:predicted lipoprotein